MREKKSRRLAIAMAGAALVLFNPNISGLLASETVVAQNIAGKRVTLNLKAVRVKQFFDAIKKQTGLNFIYNSEEARKVTPITVRCQNEDVRSVIDRVMRNAGCSYTIEGNIVTVTMLADNGPLRRLTGVVRDSEGLNMPGVNVFIRGTRYHATTNGNGEYSLKIPSSECTVSYSFIGMKTQIIQFERGIENLKRDITLGDDTKIDEVVVIGYGTSKAKDLTGSVSRLGEEDIRNSPMTSNIASALQGKAAGVNVMISNASPTSPVSVVIRGMSSLSGDGQPLWVIDGVPQYSTGVSGDISNTLYNLNLNDVQSIDILKDASATAIYGSRAANGVVIVTTKSGSEGMKPIIEFSTRIGWQTINSNDFKTLNSEQYKVFSKKANIEEAFRYGGMSYFNKRFMDESLFNKMNTSQWNREDITNIWLPNAYYNGTDNFWNMMTTNAMAQDYNLSLRGGSQSTTYFASVNYKDQDGIVKGSNSRYIGARFNFENEINKYVKFGLNIDISSRQANNKDGMISRLINIRPDYPAYNENGEINTTDPYTTNPLTELLNKYYSASRNINATGFLEYNIFPFLKYRSTLNAIFANVKYEIYNRRTSEGADNSGSQSSNNDYVGFTNLY